MKRAFLIATLFLTVGCIDIPAMNGLVDRIVPEEQKKYEVFEVWSNSGTFAPDSDQDENELTKAVQGMLGCPPTEIVTCVPQELQEISWKEDTYTFLIESEWEHNPGYVMAIFTLEYELLTNNDPGSGPAGTYNITVIDPDGRSYTDNDEERYQIVTWDNPAKDRTILMPGGIYGEWTIKISGSGLDGLASIAYSGSYSISIESEKLE